MWKEVKNILPAYIYNSPKRGIKKHFLVSNQWGKEMNSKCFLWKQWMESRLPGNCTYDTASGKTKRTVGKYCVVSCVIS